LQFLISEWEGKSLKDGVDSPTCSVEEESAALEEDHFELMDSCNAYEDFEKENQQEATQLKQAVFPEICVSVETPKNFDLTNEVKTKFECDLCLKTFTTKSNMRRHIKAHSGSYVQ